MRKLASILLIGMSVSGVLSGFTANNDVVQASMVSKREISYLLAAGKTAIPQSAGVVTVEYNGKNFDICSVELYENFEEGKKININLNSLQE